jgi:hypothetical protein
MLRHIRRGAKILYQQQNDSTKSTVIVITLDWHSLLLPLFGKFRLGHFHLVLWQFINITHQFVVRHRQEDKIWCNVSSFASAEYAPVILPDSNNLDY